MVKVLPYPFFFALKSSYFTGAWNRFKSIKKEQSYVVMWWPLWEALQSRKHSSFVCLSLPRTPSMVPNLPHLMVIKSVSVVHVCIGKTPARLVPLIPMPPIRPLCFNYLSCHRRSILSRATLASSLLLYQHHKYRFLPAASGFNVKRGGSDMMWATLAEWKRLCHWS